MKLIAAALTTAGAVLFAASMAAQESEEKTAKHHKFTEWMQLFSGEDQAKFKAAKAQALQNPAVQEARERRNKADDEYRALLHAEMFKIDPSLKPLLDKTGELKKYRDY